MPRQKRYNIKRHFKKWIFFSLGLAISGFLIRFSSVNLNFWLGSLLIFLGCCFLIYFVLKSFDEQPLLHFLAGNQKFSETLEEDIKIVVIGGGTGLGTILRGLKRVTNNLTAIVTVADDGGSSGRLREEFGILPPGDIRNCLIAMADLEPLMEQLMQFRFNEGTGLAGHNFGNLFLTAMTGITGDFQKAIEASSKVLAVRGRIFPATFDNVNLCAELKDGSIVKGESTIGQSKHPIKRIFLEPTEVRAVPESIEAIKAADIIIIGPGSLFTSVIPPLLVREVLTAVKASAATKLYICNVMTQIGETEGFTASDHLRALLEHTGSGVIDYVIINNQEVPLNSRALYAEEGAEPVIPDLEKIVTQGVIPVTAPLLNTNGLVRHDADLLVKLLANLCSNLTSSFFKNRQGLSGLKNRFFRILKILTSVKIGIITGSKGNSIVELDFTMEKIKGLPKPAFEIYSGENSILKDLIPQEIDPEENLAIGIFLGEHPVGGLMIKVTRVYLKGTGIFIYYREEESVQGGAVIQRLTYPAVLLKLKKAQLPSGDLLVYFMDEKSNNPVAVQNIVL
jgi:uncharacterized cofD-like protein